MRTRARRLLLAVCALALGLGSAAQGAGRRPYGGAIDVPVRDLSGLADPHLVTTRSGRLVASLVHGRLYRVVGSTIVPDLAAGPGTWSADVLTVPLSAHARFHDGRPVEPADVVASLERLQALGDKSPIGRIAQGLQVSEARGARAVVIAARGAVPDEVRALLARPEAAILPRGRPGVGAGPFRPKGPGAAERLVLVAWEGHARGRPWLQEVRLEIVPAAREEAAFRFGEIELAFEPLRSTPAGAWSVRGGWTSWFAILAPRDRGEGGAAVRAWVRRAMLEARLGRYVDGRTSSAATPWPEAIAPISSAAERRTGAVARETIVVAYADGEPGSEELAKAVRDVLRPAARTDARVTVVRGLDAANALAAREPAWDVALVRWEWAALTKAQAAFELAYALGLEGPSAHEVLGRRVGEWARRVVERDAALAVVHVERPATLRGKIRGVEPSGPLPELVDAWSGAL